MIAVAIIGTVHVCFEGSYLLYIAMYLCGDILSCILSVNGIQSMMNAADQMGLDGIRLSEEQIFNIYGM